MGKEQLRRILTAALAAAAVFFGLWLFSRYLLPCLLPFLLAFLTAWFLEPAIGFLCGRFRMKRGFAAACGALFLLFVFTGVAALGVSRLIYQAVDFLRDLPRLLQFVPAVSEKLEAAADRTITAAPEETRAYIVSAIERLTEKAAELPAALSARALALLPAAAAEAPKVLLFCVTYCVGVFFISRSYGEIKSFLLRQIPEKHRATARRLKSDLADGFLRWVRAELTLIAVTFAELAAALSLMGFRYAALIALVTALVDALPVLGTGTVLLPWAAALLLGGDSAGALGMAVTWLAVTVARSFLEPRLVGGSFGVHPAAALLAIYAGFKLGGVGGMVLFPIGLVLLKLTHDKGYVTLWR